MAKKQRTRYSAYKKEQVRQRYHLCRTTADKEALAQELGIGSVSKLYNLASRLGAAGRKTELQEAEESANVILREDPETIQWSKAGDRYLRDEFGRRSVEDIAYHLSHSETAVLYRARKLGLRLPVKHWRLEKASAWLGYSADDLRQEMAIDIYPLVNRKNEVAIELVSTTSIGRWLQKKRNRNHVEKHGDKFFLLEIDESIKDLVNEDSSFEMCKFLSHGHVCLNPYTENSYGLFCTNNEKYRAGNDPRCTVKTLAIEDLAPEK